MGHRARLTGVMPGEIVSVENEHGKRDPTMILGRCTSAPGYYCLTHGVRLANAHQLEAHVETSGEDGHWLASWCKTHGLEALTAGAIDAAVGHG